MGNCHPGWEAAAAEAGPAKPTGTGEGSLEERKVSAGEEELDSGGDESLEEDGESPCEGEAKEDGKAAPEKARVPRAQHFKGRMWGTTGPYQELLGLCIMDKQCGPETGEETWAGLVGRGGPVLSSSLVSPVCISALLPPPPPKQTHPFCCPSSAIARLRQKQAKFCLALGSGGMQTGLIQTTLHHLCQC